MLHRYSVTLLHCTEFHAKVMAAPGPAEAMVVGLWKRPSHPHIVVVAYDGRVSATNDRKNDVIQKGACRRRAHWKKGDAVLP